jgi:dienelactone hydrolase
MIWAAGTARRKIEMLAVLLQRNASRAGAALMAVAFLAIGAACDSSSGSSSARIEPGFGDTQLFSDHREVLVGWQSAGDTSRLQGTLYLPKVAGPHAVMIMHPGSQKWHREPWNPWYSRLADEGIAVLSYDKRGVGRSEGECCPVGDPGFFPLLADDLIGAARALALHPEIDPSRIGLYGFSQGGWVVPIAAASAPGEIAYFLTGSGPAVTLGEELLYSELTGDSQCVPSGLGDEEIERRLDVEGPSLFDPRPYIESVTQSSFWQYCDKDTSIPVARSISILEEIRNVFGTDITIQLFSNCNHTFVINGAMCQINGPRVDWQDPVIAWLRDKQIAAAVGQ